MRKRSFSFDRGEQQRLSRRESLVAAPTLPQAEDIPAVLIITRRDSLSESNELPKSHSNNDQQPQINIADNISGDGSGSMYETCLANNKKLEEQE